MVQIIRETQQITHKKWQDDRPFCDWLVGMRYAQRVDDSLEVRPFLTLGMVLYMHEAWRGGGSFAAGLL